MNLNYYAILVILLMGLVTFGLRAFPFLVFRGERELPKLMKDLGNILPASVMAVLIIYCLKDAPADFEGSGILRTASTALSTAFPRMVTKSDSLIKERSRRFRTILKRI